MVNEIPSRLVRRRVEPSDSASLVYHALPEFGLELVLPRRANGVGDLVPACGHEHDVLKRVGTTQTPEHLQIFVRCAPHPALIDTVELQDAR